MEWIKLAGAPPVGVGAKINKVLRSISERAKFYGRDKKTGKMTKGLNEALWEVPGRIAAAPVRTIGGLFGGLLHGPKLISGPMAGKRLRAVKGPGEFSAVQKKTYDAWKRGEIKGDFHSADAGWGRKHHFKRNYERGGLVGTAKKHPAATGAVALTAALLAARPDLRPLAAGLVPGGPKNPVSPEVQRQFSEEVGGASPLKKNTWG
jgi:hypothetical protein